MWYEYQIRLYNQRGYISGNWLKFLQFDLNMHSNLINFDIYNFMKNVILLMTSLLLLFWKFIPCDIILFSLWNEFCQTGRWVYPSIIQRWGRSSGSERNQLFYAWPYSLTIEYGEDLCSRSLNKFLFKVFPL